MKTSTKKLPKNQVEITIELSTEEVSPYLKNAAPRLSKKNKIEGFRPGKAPYEVIKQRFGEAPILEEALDDIIRATYIEAIGKEKLNPIDMPKIDVLKIAPGNPLSYKATISLIPQVTVGDVKKIKLEKKEVKIDDKKIDKTIKTIAESRSKEKLVNRAAKKQDVVEIDMDLLQDNVSIEGGKSNNHKVIIGEPHYIPGFDKELIGLKKDDKKDFDVTFPKEHYNKNLAGKKVKCKVEVKGIFERELPKIDDEFAKSLGGFKDIKELKSKIKENIKEEEKKKNNEKQEIKMLDDLIEISTIEEIPDVLLKEEIRKMIAELEGNLSGQGVKLEDYLSHLKKSEEDIKNDFLPQAEKRVKTALILRQYGDDNKIKITEKELEEEIEKMASNYQGNEEVQSQIRSDNYKNYLRNILNNQKIIKEIKKIITK